MKKRQNRRVKSLEKKEAKELDVDKLKKKSIDRSKIIQVHHHYTQKIEDALEKIESASNIELDEAKDQLKKLNKEYAKKYLLSQGDTAEYLLTANKVLNNLSEKVSASNIKDKKAVMNQLKALEVSSVKELKGFLPESANKSNTLPEVQKPSTENKAKTLAVKKAATQNAINPNKSIFAVDGSHKFKGTYGVVDDTPVVVLPFLGGTLQGLAFSLIEGHEKLEKGGENKIEKEKHEQKESFIEELIKNEIDQEGLENVSGPNRSKNSNEKENDVSKSKVAGKSADKVADIVADLAKDAQNNLSIFDFQDDYFDEISEEKTKSKKSNNKKKSSGKSHGGEKPKPTPKNKHVDKLLDERKAVSSKGRTR